MPRSLAHDSPPAAMPAPRAKREQPGIRAVLSRWELSGDLRSWLALAIWRERHEQIEFRYLVAQPHDKLPDPGRSARARWRLVEKSMPRRNDLRRQVPAGLVQRG